MAMRRSGPARCDDRCRDLVCCASTVASAKTITRATNWRSLSTGAEISSKAPTGSARAGWRKSRTPWTFRWASFSHLPGLDLRGWLHRGTCSPRRTPGASPKTVPRTPGPRVQPCTAKLVEDTADRTSGAKITVACLKTVDPGQRREVSLTRIVPPG